MTQPSGLRACPVNPAALFDSRTRQIIDRARLLCMEAAQDNDPECAFEAGVELEALLDDDELARARLARMRTDACGNFTYDHAAADEVTS